VFNIGGPEVLVILLLALIVLGPQRLPEAAKQIGKAMGELRRMSSGFQQELRSALDEPTEAAARQRGAALQSPAATTGAAPPAAPAPPVPAADDVPPATTPAPATRAAAAKRAPAKAPARKRSAPLRAAGKPAPPSAP
jgi:sec-independent protein translocase protein TatB